MPVCSWLSVHLFLFCLLTFIPLLLFPLSLYLTSSFQHFFACFLFHFGFFMSFCLFNSLSLALILLPTCHTPALFLPPSYAFFSPADNVVSGSMTRNHSAPLPQHHRTSSVSRKLGRQVTWMNVDTQPPAVSTQNFYNVSNTPMGAAWSFAGPLGTGG